MRNAKRDIYNDLIKSKVSKYSYPELSMTFDGLRRIGDFFSDAEDRGIFILLSRVGYGFWDQLKDEITKSELFRNNWFVRTRTPQELQARCDRLIRCVEREVETKQDVTKEEPSTARGTLDERVPDCWYDGNTSCSENEMEVSQRRLNRVTDQGTSKRKRSSAQSGNAKKRSVSLKFQSPPASVKGDDHQITADIPAPSIETPGNHEEELLDHELEGNDVEMNSPVKDEPLAN
jgi:SWI/SNF-related matrix-associated actin-dependent regulator of chromatin subfamily A member 5